MTTNNPATGPGRPQRPEPKSKPIWCGQISEADRAYILQHTTPEQRFQALMETAVLNGEISEKGQDE